MSDATLGEDAPVYIPREQLPIPFFDDAVLAVRREDGQIYLNIREMYVQLTGERLDIVEQEDMGI